jgi:hypothetical protein
MQARILNRVPSYCVVIYEAGDVPAQLHAALLLYSHREQGYLIHPTCGAQGWWHDVRLIVFRIDQRAF